MTPAFAKSGKSPLQSRASGAKQEKQMSENLISLLTVRERIGHISSTTIWRMRRANQFPEPVVISPNRKAWRESDVDKWIDARTTDPLAA